MADSAIPSYVPFNLRKWNGLVLIKSGPLAGKPIQFSTPEAWRTWLETLVTDSHRLPEAKVLKTSKTVEVLHAQLPLVSGNPPGRVICKQAKTITFKDLLLRFIRASAARRNFNMAQALQRHNIATALPLAFLENPTTGSSWLVTEFLEDVVDLDAYVLMVLSRSTPMMKRCRRNVIIASIANLFRSLERAGFYHRDMKASNILLAHTADSMAAPESCIVDLDGLEKRRPWRSAWKPIVRLAASLLQYPAVTRTDYIRFLREYSGASGQDRSTWRSHYHRLRKQAARYARAAQRRKSNKLDGFSGS